MSHLSPRLLIARILVSQAARMPTSAAYQPINSNAPINVRAAMLESRANAAQNIATVISVPRATAIPNPRPTRVARLIDFDDSAQSNSAPATIPAHNGVLAQMIVRGKSRELIKDQRKIVTGSALRAAIVPKYAAILVCSFTCALTTQFTGRQQAAKPAVAAPLELDVGRHSTQNLGPAHKDGLRHHKP